MQEIAFQSIRNQKFFEWGVPGGVNPLFKKILYLPLNCNGGCKRKVILFN